MSNRTLYSFGPLPTLSTAIWTTEKLKQDWKWKDRFMEPVMQRFIDLNQRSLGYLGISAQIESVNGKPALKLRTSKYIGTAPLLSPMTGKIAGDLIVSGRFGENASDLFPLLGNSIHPEYSDELHLSLESQMTPPIFIECGKYIDKYIEAEKFQWRKFSNTVKVQRNPSGSTLWGEYALRTAKNPLELGVFKNKSNILSTEHEEWGILNFVLKLAMSEMERVEAPIRMRIAYSERISQLRNRLRDKLVVESDTIKQRMSDPLVIKQLKDLANTILQKQTNEKLAWRLDYAEFFERYVQFLLGDVAKKKGAKAIDNPHYGLSYSRKPSWALSYLEPDLILQKGESQFVIDAKYKSHMFNLNNESEDLKDTFRHDLHQILAYCSFNRMDSKKAFLVYPCNKFELQKIKMKSPLTNSELFVSLIGIPLEKNKIEEIEEKLSEVITF